MENEGKGNEREVSDEAVEGRLGEGMRRVEIFAPDVMASKPPN
jgi:hypothetical protein